MADRLLTAGILQYQPARSKIYPITKSVFAMLSGEDIALAAELIEDVKTRVAAAIQANPTEWWSVKNTAELWREVYLERRGRESETTILSHLGLTRDTFISRNQELAPSLVERISNELVNFEIAGTEVIFAGTDGTGPHLYVAHNASVKCNDAIGYAAVGIGAYHARSQFITSSHTPDAPFNRTIFVTYAAKRRAEAAPGVGKDTDTFFTYMPGEGGPIREDVIDLVTSIYDTMEKTTKESLEKSLGEAHDQITRIITADAPKHPDQQQIPKDENPTPPTDN